jgi:hypothetical protein
VPDVVQVQNLLTPLRRVNKNHSRALAIRRLKRNVTRFPRTDTNVKGLMHRIVPGTCAVIARKRVRARWHIHAVQIVSDFYEVVSGPMLIGFYRSFPCVAPTERKP